MPVAATAPARVPTLVLAALLISPPVRAQFIPDDPPPSSAPTPAPSEAPHVVDAGEPWLTPPPPRSRRRGSVRAGLVVTGALLLGVAYVQSAGAGFAFGAGTPSKWVPGFFIPVVGPVLIKYNDPFTETAFALNTVAQLAGATLLVVAYAVRWPAADPPVSVVPLALERGGGVGLRARF